MVSLSSLRCKLTAEELALLCRSWHLYRLAVCSEDCSDLYVGETLLSRIRILAREGRWFERGVKEAIYVKLNLTEEVD